MASKLREFNEVRRKLEKKSSQLRVKEFEQNLIKNLPENSNQESAIREVKNRLQQKLKLQQIKDSVQGQQSNGISYIVIPQHYKGYPYSPVEVEEWKSEHQQEK